jgi:hypothetical protein
MKLISLVLFSETWRNLYNLLVSVDNSCYNFVFVNLSNHYGLADAGKKNKMRLPILFISLQMQDYYTYNEKNSYHFLTLITAGWQSRNLLLRGPCFNCDRAPGPAHLKGGEGGGGGDKSKRCKICWNTSTSPLCHPCSGDPWLIRPLVWARQRPKKFHHCWLSTICCTTLLIARSIYKTTRSIS